MPARTAWEYIYLGTALRFLQDATVGTKIHEPNWVLTNADSLRRLLGDYGLPVSSAVFDLKVKRVCDDLRALPVGSVLTAPLATRLRDAMSELRTTITAEAGATWLFAASSSRYPINALLYDVAPLLGAGVLPALSPMAKFDVQSSALCLSLGISTAAAFHVMRATEETLRRTYASTHAAGDPDVRMWAQIIDAMRARTPRNVSEVLLEHLDNIRKNFRNPTQHPDAVYAIDEAYDLFALCCEVITRMAKYLPPPPPQPPPASTDTVAPSS